MSAVSLSRNGVVTTLTLDRPEARNALEPAMMIELRDLVTALAQDGTRVLVLTGAGDAFCAGLALGLADGDDLELAARFANAVASFAVEGVGTAALASRDQVQARMGTHSPSLSSKSSDGTPPGRTIP